MRTLLCFLLLITTVFAEGVIELRFDGQKWLMEDVVVDQAVLEQLAKNPRDLALRAGANTQMKHFQDVIQFWHEMEKGDLIFRLEDKSASIAREDVAKIEKMRESFAQLHRHGGIGGIPAIFGIYGKALCFTGDLIDEQGVSGPEQVYMHLDGRGEEFYTKSIKRLVAREPDMAMIFATSDATLYADYFAALSKLRETGVEKVLPIVTDQFARILGPIVLIDKEVMPPVGFKPDKEDPKSYIVVDITPDGVIKSGEGKLLVGDEAIGDYILESKKAIEGVAKLRLTGDGEALFKYSRKVIKIAAERAGLNQVVFSTIDLAEYGGADDKKKSKEKAKPQPWIPEKADFGPLDLEKLELRPKENELPMTLPRDEGKERLDAVEVKISLDGKGVSINGKFHGMLNKEQHKAASEQLQALKETGELDVSLKAEDNAPQSLVIDVINLLVGLEINKVNFTDLAE